MASIENFATLCRLCLVQDEVNIPIFEETNENGHTFAKINSCLPVKVSRDDNLPKKICDGCSYKLDMLYTFRNTSVDSEKQLIEWLNSAGLSTISKESKDPLSSTTNATSTSSAPATASKAEVTVKQETFDTIESRLDGDLEDGDESNSYMQSYDQDFEFGGEASGSADMDDEEPPLKKTKRTVKKQPVEDDEENEEGEDDLDAAMQITKAEDDDSDEIDQPDYVEPSTSADDQPGPSGVGKTPTEAPSSIKQFSCRICHRKYATLRHLSKHRYCHKNTKWFCCGRQYSTLTTYERHRTAKHEKIAVMCEVCGKTLKDKFTYKKHKLLHVDGYKSRFLCKMCNKTFANKYHLSCHQRVVHEGYRIICDLCGKALTSQRGLVDHLRTHSNEKPYKCEQCGRAFAKYFGLSKHYVVHTKQKPYVCEVCGNGYTQRGSLVDHIKSIHTNQKPWICAMCPKRFIKRVLLNRHMIVHKKT